MPSTIIQTATLGDKQADLKGRTLPKLHYLVNKIVSLAVACPRFDSTPESSQLVYEDVTLDGGRAAADRPTSS